MDQRQWAKSPWARTYTVAIRLLRHPGPNGFHDSLITEIVVPLASWPSLSGRLWGAEDPRFTTQLVEGFPFLHGQGITHGGELPLVHSAVFAA